MGFLTKLADDLVAFISRLCACGCDDEGEQGPIPLRHIQGSASHERAQSENPAATTRQPTYPPAPATPSAPAQQFWPYAYAPASPPSVRDTGTRWPPSQPPLSRPPRTYAYVSQRVPPLESTSFVRDHRPARSYNATDRTSYVPAPAPVIERERRPYQQVFSQQSDGQEAAYGRAGDPGQRLSHAQQKKQRPTRQRPRVQKPHQQKPDGPIHPQGKASSHLSSPPPQGRSYGDSHQVNQYNPEYVALRRRANEEGDAMRRARDESQKAFRREGRVRAKELSEQWKQHKGEMEKLHARASAWIYKANNEGRRPGEIDLHGLFVKEAVEYADRAIQVARARGDHEVHLIVGKGLHSENNVPKIRPAIEKHIKRHRLVAALHPTNTGVIVVQLGRGKNKA